MPALQTDFSGLWIPLVTPFKHGEVDHPALTKLVQHYQQFAIAGLVVCGSTGEAAALDDNEQLAVLTTVMAAVHAPTGDSAAKLKVVMGLSGYHLPATCAWVKVLARLPLAGPLAGLLAPAPHYIRPSQAGLLQWFTAIAEAAAAAAAGSNAMPLILYDIPYRTGVEIGLETLRQLAQHPNIVAIKDCGGDAAKTQALVHDGALQVLAGDDAQIFTTMALGGVGAIAAAAHLRTAEFAEVIRLLQRGDLLKARAAWAPLPAHIAAMFAEPNPACIKAALAGQGLICNELRLPMVAARSLMK